MQIVIDIPEYVIEDIKECGFIPDEDNEELYKVINNGTVLPKHGRLIEVTDELDYQLSTYERWTGIDEMPYEYAVTEIRNAPTILEATE